MAALFLFELLGADNFYQAKIVFTWFGLLITSMVVWLMVEGASFYLSKKTGQPLSGWAMLVAVGALYLDALGDIFGFYNWNFQGLWYDQIAHFWGGLAAGAVVFSVMSALIRAGIMKMNRTALFILTVALTGLLGQFYEIEEYLEDYFRGSNRLGDGVDTANDMLLNIIGSTVSVGVGLALKKKTGVKKT